MRYSKDFSWIPSPSGAVEYFGSQTCEVNISALKLMLSQEQWPVLPRPLTDIVYDQSGNKLIMNKIGERLVKAEVVAKADVTLPLVAAFLPIARHSLNGSILWGTDIVDGFHRLAAAKIRGLPEMPVILAPPLPSVIVTKPKTGFIGPIAPESDFLMFNLEKPNPDLFTELTRHVGARFDFGVSD